MRARSAGLILSMLIDRTMALVLFRSLPMQLMDLALPIVKYIVPESLSHCETLRLKAEALAQPPTQDII